MTRYADETLLWHEWNPGLDNDHQTLGEVIDTMPGAPPSEIPLWIRLFENPASPVAFPGAVTLERHDALHVVLGRGLTIQDEAFVIGYTMGSDIKMHNLHAVLFRFIATKLYRRPYKFKKRDLIPFQLGIWEGKNQKADNLHEFPFENYRDLSLRELRDKLKINRQRLHSVYAYEKSLIPDSKASKRLDIDYDNLDPSTIQPPKAEASGWKKEK